jgi:hypothetical protein
LVAALCHRPTANHSGDNAIYDDDLSRAWVRVSVRGLSAHAVPDLGGSRKAT